MITTNQPAPAWIAGDAIDLAADAAVTNFEFSCNWRHAHTAAKEALTDAGHKPTNHAAGLAVNLAKLRWMAFSMEVARER